MGEADAGLEPQTPTLSMGGAGSPHELPTNETCCASRADAGTRTPDPFITSEVLYQLSYVGVWLHGAISVGLCCNEKYRRNLYGMPTVPRPCWPWLALVVARPPASWYGAAPH